MDAVGGRPEDGVEIEAVLRRFFGDVRQPRADVTTGLLQEITALNDAEAPKMPWGLYDLEQRVRRVGSVRIEGDEATADFSAVSVPSQAPASAVEPEHVVKFEGPMKLLRVDGRWKLADFYRNGVLNSDETRRLRGEKTAGGVTVRPRFVIGGRKSWAVKLSVDNGRDHPVWGLPAAALRPPLRFHEASPRRWITLEPGESDTTTIGWEGVNPLWRSRIRILVPFFDLARRRWVRVLVRGDVVEA